VVDQQPKCDDRCIDKLTMPRGALEWEQGRMLQVQYHDIKSGDLEQFRGMDTQTVLTPPQYKTGDLIYPYEKAK
jgi:hypothetical protein